MSAYATIGIQLQERLDQLLRRVRRIEGDLRSSHDPDSQERATELENDEVLAGLDQMSLADVRQIREAQKRIALGLYGTCAICGQPVSAARLAAFPTTAACIGCATESEGASSETSVASRQKP